MDQNQSDAMMDNYLVRLAKKEPSGWSEQARAWAEEKGIISGDAVGADHVQ